MEIALGTDDGFCATIRNEYAWDIHYFRPIHKERTQTVSRWLSRLWQSSPAQNAKKPPAPIIRNKWLYLCVEPAAPMALPEPMRNCRSRQEWRRLFLVFLYLPLRGREKLCP